MNIKKPLLLLCLAFAAIASKAETMPVMKIEYDESALNYDTYIKGKMTLTDVDGSVVTLNTQFKTRGATARMYPMKPALNMKLRDEMDESLDYNLLGLREASSFILDAMAIDRINMRNRVCFDIWNEFSKLPYESDFEGRNGTVGKFVEMYINDNYKGIYCVTDKINRKLLNLKKPKTNDDGSLQQVRGVLYKHGTNDIEDQNNPGFFVDNTVYIPQWHDAWELHEPEDFPCAEAWQPLVDLYNNSNYDNIDYVKEHFYLENLADYTIHLMALSISDNWGNKNKYFSIVNIAGDDPDTRFVVTPWDLDTSLGGEYDGSKYDGDYLHWPIEDIVKSAPLPFAAAMRSDEFHNIMRTRWIAGRAGALSIESVKSRLQAYADLFISSGAWQRTVELWADKEDDYCEKYVNDLQKEIDLIGKWYEKRFAEMDEYFQVAGVENVSIDNNRGETEIYTVDGIRVNETVPGNIYIVRQGQNVEKRIVK